MQLGIMQPYFFPYVGYFQLMQVVDRWIAFDEVQFIDKGWINRNRILHPQVEKEWQFITLPLAKRGQFDRICDLHIKADGKWRAQILGKLTSYKRKAPFYPATVELVERCFDTDETRLAPFLVRSLRLTARHLGIETPIALQSELALSLGEVQRPGQWALRICQALGASGYLNPPGGADIFDADEYERAGVSLRFLRPRLTPYVQRRGGFVSGLSMLDVMMWNEPEAISQMLRADFDVLTKAELG